MTQQAAASPLSIDFPTVVKESQIEQARKLVREASALIAPLQAAIERAQNEILVTLACDLVERTPDIDTISLNVSSESDDEGGSFLCMNVNVEYLEPEGDGEEGEREENDISYELHDILTELTGEIDGSDLDDASVEPEDFPRMLAEAVLGEAHSKAWLAAREAAKISEVVEPAPKATPRAL